MARPIKYTWDYITHLEEYAFQHKCSLRAACKHKQISYVGVVRSRSRYRKWAKTYIIEVFK